MCKVCETKAPRFIILVYAFRSGGKLNGHGGTVHGVVLSLLFDEAKGGAYECLRLINGRLVLILAGALFYGTVSFQKKLVSKYTVP